MRFGARFESYPIWNYCGLLFFPMCFPPCSHEEQGKHSHILIKNPFQITYLWRPRNNRRNKGGASGRRSIANNGEFFELLLQMNPDYPLFVAHFHHGMDYNEVRYCPFPARFIFHLNKWCFKNFIKPSQKWMNADRTFRRRKAHRKIDNRME